MASLAPARTGSGILLLGLAIDVLLAHAYAFVEHESPRADVPRRDCALEAVDVLLAPGLELEGISGVGKGGLGGDAVRIVVGTRHGDDKIHGVIVIGGVAGTTGTVTRHHLLDVVLALQVVLSHAHAVLVHESPRTNVPSGDGAIGARYELLAPRVELDHVARVGCAVRVDAVRIVVGVGVCLRVVGIVVVGRAVEERQSERRNTIWSNDIIVTRISGSVTR